MRGRPRAGQVRAQTSETVKHTRSRGQEPQSTLAHGPGGRPWQGASGGCRSATWGAAAGELCYAGPGGPFGFGPPSVFYGYDMAY